MLLTSKKNYLNRFIEHVQLRRKFAKVSNYLNLTIDFRTVKLRAIWMVIALFEIYNAKIPTLVYVQWWHT